MVAFAAGTAPVRAESPAAPNGARSTVADEPATSDQRGAEQKEHMRVGVIGAVGFPRPFAVEAMIKLERAVSLGLECSTVTLLSLGALF